MADLTDEEIRRWIEITKPIEGVALSSDRLHCVLVELQRHRASKSADDASFDSFSSEMMNPSPPNDKLRELFKNTSSADICHACGRANKPTKA